MSAVAIKSVLKSNSVRVNITVKFDKEKRTGIRMPLENLLVSPTIVWIDTAVFRVKWKI